MHIPEAGVYFGEGQRSMTGRDVTIAGLSAVIDRRYSGRTNYQSFRYRPLVRPHQRHSQEAIGKQSAAGILLRVKEDNANLSPWSVSAPYWEKHRKNIRRLFSPITAALITDAHITPGPQGPGRSYGT